MHHVDLDRPVILACNLELGVLAVLLGEACCHASAPQPSVKSWPAGVLNHVILG